MHCLTRRILGVVLLSSLPVVDAMGQVCLGKPSLTVAPTNIGVSADFTDGARGVGGSFGFGNARSFGGVGVGYLSYPDFDVSSTVFTGAGGLSIPVAEGSAVRVCPVAQASYGYGPNETTALGELKLSTIGVLGGVSIGGAVEVNPGFSVIPHARGGVLFRRTSASLAGNSDSESETGGVIGGGVSLLFGTIFAIEPSVSVPVGFDGSDPVFSIGVTVGLKRRQ